jgi:hypothetical protein
MLPNKSELSPSRSTRIPPSSTQDCRASPLRVWFQSGLGRGYSDLGSPFRRPCRHPNLRMPPSPSCSPTFLVRSPFVRGREYSGLGSQFLRPCCQPYLSLCECVIIPVTFESSRLPGLLRAMPGRVPVLPSCSLRCREFSEGVHHQLHLDLMFSDGVHHQLHVDLQFGSFPLVPALLECCSEFSDCGFH